MAEQVKPNRKLTAELERLKRMFDIGHELAVTWIPGRARYVHGRKIGGEVRGDVVYIYAKNEPEALLILRHEFLENALNEKFVLPYQRFINVLLTAFEEQNYAEKEKIVKKLADFIWGEGEKETE